MANSYCICHDNKAFKVDAGGQQVWQVVPYGGTCGYRIQVDKDGNVYTGNNNGSNSISKYTSSGAGPSTYTIPGLTLALAVDITGAVYGASSNLAKLLKFDGSKNELWRVLNDGPNDVVACESGNSFVSDSPVNRKNVRKLNASGGVIWSSTIYNVVPKVGACDLEESVYAGGMGISSLDVYDTNGVKTSFVLDNAFYNVVVDKDKNRFITTGDTFTRKFDSAHNPIWAADGAEVSHFLSLDSDGCSYVRAFHTTGITSYSKLNSGGGLEWTFVGSDTINGIAADPGAVGAGFWGTDVFVQILSAHSQMYGLASSLFYNKNFPLALDEAISKFVPSDITLFLGWVLYPEAAVTRVSNPIPNLWLVSNPIVQIAEATAKLSALDPELRLSYLLELLEADLTVDSPDANYYLERNPIVQILAATLQMSAEDVLAYVIPYIKRPVTAVISDIRMKAHPTDTRVKVVLE